MTLPLDDYLDLIDRERARRPAESMLADEIHRLRAANDALRAMVMVSTKCDSAALDMAVGFCMRQHEAREERRRAYVDPPPAPLIADPALITEIPRP